MNANSFYTRFFGNLCGTVLIAIIWSKAMDNYRTKYKEIQSNNKLITLARVGGGYSVSLCVCLSVCYHKIAVNFNYLEI